MLKKKTELETEEEAEKRQARLTTIPEDEEEGEGLKIMTPNQLLTRLLLAQKKAGSNSQKLNNEIRQIIHF